MQLDDGKGRGNKAAVNSSNRLNVSSRVNARIYYVSRDKGRVFSVVSEDSTAASGEMTFHMKNTSSTRDLYISHMDIAAENACGIKLFKVTGTAASGTALTPVNLNLTSNHTAEGDFSSGEAAAITGLTTDGLIHTVRVEANSSDGLHFSDSLILGPTDQIAVEYNSGATGPVEINTTFYYEDIDVDQ